MKINQVEELTGIPKKNIRFYEDQKLISPQRNSANGYREYSMEDVALLGKIKLFRKLGIPIESIRKMESGEQQLDDCLYKKVHELKAARQSAEQMQIVCQEILSKQARFDTINSDIYLEEIERLEKGGTQFVNVEQKDKKQSTVIPIIFAGLIVLLMIALTALVWYLNSVDPAPFGVVQIITLVALAVCAGVIIACRERIKEIKGGELDEARNY
jgi:DNA-binding transcriptional MerR regulator